MSVTPDLAGNLLGFDFSAQRIGVALATTVTRAARALTTLHSPAKGGVDWDAITGLLEQWKPVAVVVGLPLTVDGGEQQETINARRFGQRLHGRYGVRVHFQDERYTTQLAKESRPPRGPRAAQGVDAIAAQIILQSWLDGVAQQSTNGVQ